VQLAHILTEEGRLAEAEEVAHKAVDAFRSGKDSEREASAHLALADIYVAQRKVVSAQEELKQALSLAGNPVNREARFDSAIMAARVDAAAGDFEKALRKLDVIWSEAVRYGYVSYQLDVRLARGEIEIKAGQNAKGQDHLTALAKDSAAKGFVLVARKAAAAAKHFGERGLVGQPKPQ
jgi:tetratricopeptide (TPR) repeat protein